MNTKIKFGTDGFRGIIGKNFTYEAVRKITVAIAEYLRGGTIIIGYDPRKDADKFARQSAEILAEFGFEVLLSEKVVPTPVIAYATRNIISAGAIMFTASHNPPEYLGIKFIPNYGGPATSDITREIEHLIEDKICTLEKNEGSIKKYDFSQIYFDGIDKLIDFEVIKNNQPKVIYDGLFSASIGYFDKILRNKGIEFEIYNDYYDSNFGGFLPEPKKEFMQHSKVGYITLANDGDADRYGIIDEEGNYVSPNLIMAILLKYLKEKGMNGSVIKTVGVSQIVDVVAEKLAVPVVETAVGFKYIGEKMREIETILGGEDSGGLSTGNHISEKDGIYANLLIMEMLAKTNKTLNQLVNEIVDFAGVEFVQDRIDVKLDSDDKKDEIIYRISNEESFAVQNIVKRTEIDGVKLYLEDGVTKILIRKSGTEPLLRFYIETNSNSKLQSIKEFIKGYMFIVK